MSDRTTRRSFLQAIGVGSMALGAASAARPADKPIQGFEESSTAAETSKGWKPLSERKIRVGIAGYGTCKFGAAFGFQNHPNVTVAAVTDLVPDRRDQLSKACRCEKTYPSLEEMVRDDTIEAVFVATDAPSHPRHCIEVLEHGKHVATAVPATWGSIEEGERVLEAVKSSGFKYMMFETSCFHEDLFAMRQIYKAGGFGKLVYAEGEYYHYLGTPIASWKEWRLGSPPQWYPTHATAYYIGVTGGSFTEVACLGMPGNLDMFKTGNRYKNPFGTEVALLRTSEGGMARMVVSKDTPGNAGEKGRIRGQRGSFYEKYEGLESNLPDLKRPPLPPGVNPGGHGGAHGFLMNEFVTAILENRQPLVDIYSALNMTVAGIVAHQSALRGGELMKIPQYPRPA